VLSEIQADLQPLLTFPLSGPAREELAPGLRVKFHGVYAIYYTPSAAELVVVRVLHTARDIAAIAERGGFEG
jgi:toxin ParE1/3/4